MAGPDAGADAAADAGFDAAADDDGDVSDTPRSSGSGSGFFGELGSEAGPTIGLVTSACGTPSAASSIFITKNASPFSPTFIANGSGSGEPLRCSVTLRSSGRSTLSFPKRTWNGDAASSVVFCFSVRSVPSSCVTFFSTSTSRSTTMTSIAPFRVDGLMLGVMVLYTEDTSLPTYCIAPSPPRGTGRSRRGSHVRTRSTAPASTGPAGHVLMRDPRGAAGAGAAAARVGRRGGRGDRWQGGYRVILRGRRHLHRLGAVVQAVYACEGARLPRCPALRPTQAPRQAPHRAPAPWCRDARHVPRASAFAVPQGATPCVSSGASAASASRALRSRRRWRRGAVSRGAHSNSARGRRHCYLRRDSARSRACRAARAHSRTGARRGYFPVLACTGW